MQVAVTGATGFIGRNLVAALRGHGYSVTAVTRLGGAAAARAAFGSDVSAVEYDLSNPQSDVWAAIGRPDACVHLAWSALTDFDSLDHVARELPLHLGFLTALVRSGLPRLMVTGTCLEYGLQSGALHEELSPDPVTAYGVAKDTLRRSLQRLQRETAFELVWARLFYVQSYSGVRRTLLSQLAEAVARGDASFAMSSGEQLRDYLTVEAQADLLARLATAQGDAGVVNICSGKPVSVRRLVEEQIAAHDWQIALDLGKYLIPPYEPLAFWGDTRKLNRCLQ